MAVLEVVVTTIPTAVTGPVVGTRYVVQNQGGATVYVDTTDTAPADASAPGIAIAPAPLTVAENQRGVPPIVELDAGQSLYLWTRSGVSKVAWTEAV